jgi:hypothetical protein
VIFFEKRVVCGFFLFEFFILKSSKLFETTGFLTVYLKIIIDISANIDDTSLKTGRIRML